ncbi:MAG: hypothetical protein NTW35_00400 [Candidatus Nomurabacteria bacterium]|nr:hypothetical protein [Candidatus Nomurabacteria bacterium]
MNATGSQNGASIEGPGRIFWNQNGMVILTSGQALVTGSDENTTLQCLGRGDVTFVAGDGNNIANGGVGNDIFIGGAGYNRFYGGNGNDTLVGGSFINDLNGGNGNDTLIFGQNDQVSGGTGIDQFIFIAKENTGNVSYGDIYTGHDFAFIRDLKFWEGDTLDLSMCPELIRENMKVVDDALMVFGPERILHIEGIGHQITLAGGLDAAIMGGEILINDPYYYYGMTPHPPTVGVAEVSLVGIATTTSGDHSVPVGGKG